MKFSIHLIIILLFNCISDKKVSNLDLSISESIVLINIGSSDRNAIAKALDWLGKCETKIVAINTVFSPNNYTKADTSLSKSIKSLGNVILIFSANLNSTESSDVFFQQNSIAEGIIGFSYNDEKIFQKLTIPVGDQLRWSFSFTVASYYKPELTSHLLATIMPDTYYDVFIDRKIDQYLLINENELNNITCTNLKDKIILMGDLDSNTEDVIVLSKTNKKYNTTVILANIIENILNGKLTKSKDVE